MAARNPMHYRRALQSLMSLGISISQLISLLPIGKTLCPLILTDLKLICPLIFTDLKLICPLICAYHLLLCPIFATNQ